MFFHFHKIENFGISVFVKERNKALKSRPLKSSMLSYLGVELINENLNTTTYLTTILTSTQTLDSEAEEDKKCKLYPKMMVFKTTQNVMKILFTTKWRMNLGTDQDAYMTLVLVAVSVNFLCQNKEQSYIW